MVLCVSGCFGVSWWVKTVGCSSGGCCCGTTRSPGAPTGLDRILEEHGGHGDTWGIYGDIWGAPSKGVYGVSMGMSLWRSLSEESMWGLYVVYGSPCNPSCPSVVPLTLSTVPVTPSITQSLPVTLGAVPVAPRAIPGTSSMIPAQCQSLPVHPSVIPVTPSMIPARNPRGTGWVVLKGPGLKVHPVPTTAAGRDTFH